MSYLKVIFAIVIIASFGVSFSLIDSRSAQFDSKFNLRFTQSAIISSKVLNRVDNIKIIFPAVIEDSRCPQDTICVWGGEV